MTQINDSQFVMWFSGSKLCKGMLIELNVMFFLIFKKNISYHQDNL